MNKKRMKEEYIISDVAKELQNILRDEDIISKQKCFIYSQYKTYKELYLNLIKSNIKLFEENKRLYGMQHRRDEDELDENLGDKENINNNLCNKMNEDINKDNKYTFNIDDFVNDDFQDNKFSYESSNSSLEVGKNIVDQLSDLKKELELKEKRIIELENSVLKYQIMRRSNTTKSFGNESQDMDVYKEEIINLKTKIEYLRLEKERESINFNNRINEYKIKYEEINSLYKSAADNLNSSLLNLENIRSNNKSVLYEKLRKMESIEVLLRTISETIDDFTLEVDTINFNYKELYKMYEIEKENSVILNKKLSDFKFLANKENEAKGDEFYEQEISNLLETCNALAEENKEMSKVISEYKCKYTTNFQYQKDDVIAKLENNRRRDIAKYIETINGLNKRIDEYISKLKEADNEKNRLTKHNLERIKHNERYQEEIKLKDIKILCLENKYNKTVDMIKDFKREIEERYKESILCNQNVDKVNLKCNLCDINDKNIAITSCMHTFCEGCINTRIKMRDRKCPTCGLMYNVYEVKKIYF